MGQAHGRCQRGVEEETRTDYPVVAVAQHQSVGIVVKFVCGEGDGEVGE